MSRKLKKLVPPLFLGLIPLLLFWRIVFGGQVLYWGLPLYQFYPWHTLVVEAIGSGHLPLWTDLLGNGTPLLANHQSATFYPPNLIYLVMPVERAMGYSVVLHLIMAGLFAYAWGRTIRLTRFGATVTGLSFMLSGFLVSRTQFITIVNGAAWLPLLFLLVEHLVRRRTLLDAVWLGVVMALQFLAGHAQLWFYSLWVVAAYALVRVWWMRREYPGQGLSQDIGRPPGSPWPLWRSQGGQKPWEAYPLWRGHILALLAGALVLSLGLSAVQLLPTAELSFYSQRVGGLDPDEAMTYSFWPWRLLTLAIPDLFGSPATGDYWGYATYWEDAGYIGVLPLLLAFSALWGWLRRGTREGGTGEAQVQKGNNEPLLKDAEPDGILIPFFLLLILFSLVLAMGKNTPIYPLVFKYVPGFGVFRSPARFTLFYTFAASTLAGIGADRFRLTYRTQYVARLTVAGGAAMLVVSLLAGQLGLMIKPTFAPALAHFAVLLALSTISLLLGPARAGPGEGEWAGLDPRVARSPLPLWAWRGLLVCLIAVDLALFAAPLTPTIDATLYTASTTADRFLLARDDDARLFATYDYDYDTKFNTYFDFSGWGPTDLAHWLDFRETAVPNLGIFSRSLYVNNDDPLVVGRWRELMEVLRSTDWPQRLRVLRLMNVGYVLTETSVPGLSPVAEVSHLHRVSETLPRAWVVSRARVLSDAEDLLSELMAPGFDPAAEVLLESTPCTSGRVDDPDLGDVFSSVSPSLSTPPPGSPIPPVITSLREEANSRTIGVIVSQPGYLMLTYTYYPDWRVTVDGRPTEILRADYAFMAVPLVPGEHQVTLRYQPVSVSLGAAISGVSLLLVIGMVALGKVSELRGKVL